MPVWVGSATLAAMWRSDQPFADRPRLLRPADAISLFGDELSDADREHLRIAHLDEDGLLLGLSEQIGGHDALVLSLKDIARDALNRDSRRLLIAHNHPSGDPTPSAADRAATRRLAELLRMLKIELVDHLVFARGGVASFRQLGLL